MTDTRNRSPRAVPLFIKGDNYVKSHYLKIETVHCKTQEGV